MKKNFAFIAFIIVFALLISACGKTVPDNKTDVEKERTTTAENVATADTDPAGNSDDSVESQPDDTAPPTDGGNGVLVVVFSATGTTKGVAEKIADLTDANLYEITPAVPYTSDDLDWNDDESRTSKEQNDDGARPEIGSADISLDGYKTVYLGYPIWWGQAPRIMSTFVEKYDFSGITVVPFCTSGSSDIGESDDTLAEQAGSGDWIQGRRFSGGATVDELREWIEETGETNMEKTLHLYIDGNETAVIWENNESVKALTELVLSGPLTVRMSKYGGFEQVGSLGTGLPSDDERITTEAGDIVLYSGDQLVIFYGSNSWAYTKLGKITGRSAADLEELLGGKDVTVTISFE